MMDETTEPRAVRLGVIPDSGQESGCAACGHPLSLHGNGATGCRALRCSGGPAVVCAACGGTTVNVVTCKPCEPCKGIGTVATACPSFSAIAPPEAELIAS